MSKVWYGSLQNRLEEGHNFTGREIRPGDDGTLYMWSDRHPFWVTSVEDQKRIHIREYYHCADHSKEGGMGHQNWLLFKTWDEWNDYLAKYFPEHHKAGEHREEPPERTLVFRYNKWMYESKVTDPLFCSNKREEAQMAKNGYFKAYRDLGGEVSFGVAEYYYDWEF